MPMPVGVIRRGMPSTLSYAYPQELSSLPRPSRLRSSVRIAALLLGGTVAAGSHGAKAATRIGANLSPEPFSNFALSLFEDMVVIGSSILIAFHPVVLIAIVTLFLCVMVWLF